MAPVIMRSVLVTVLVAVLIVLVPGTSHALTELGQVCMSLTALSVGAPGGTVRLSMTQSLGSATLVAVNFRWIFGDAFMVGTGTISDLPAPSTGPGFKMVLIGMHDSPTLFARNPICALSVSLQPPTFVGSWQYTCVGASPSPAFPYVNSGTSAVVPCTPSM